MYGWYGTETASAVVIGHTESVGAQVLSLSTFVYPFVTTLLFISSYQGKYRP